MPVPTTIDKLAPLAEQITGNTIQRWRSALLPAVARAAQRPVRITDDGRLWVGDGKDVQEFDLTDPAARSQVDMMLGGVSEGTRAMSGGRTVPPALRNLLAEITQGANIALDNTDDDE